MQMYLHANSVMAQQPFHTPCVKARPGHRCPEVRKSHVTQNVIGLYEIINYQGPSGTNQNLCDI